MALRFTGRLHFKFRMRHSHACRADAFGSDPWLLNLRPTVQAAIQQRTRVLVRCAVLHGAALSSAVLCCWPSHQAAAWAAVLCDAMLHDAADCSTAACYELLHGPPYPLNRASALGINWWAAPWAPAWATPFIQPASSTSCPPVQGVCFGHQLVGCTLGARVGRAGCWEVGARRISVVGEARERLAAAGAGWARLLPDALCLHEFHQDQVGRGCAAKWGSRVLAALSPLGSGWAAVGSRWAAVHRSLGSLCAAFVCRRWRRLPLAPSERCSTNCTADPWLTKVAPHFSLRLTGS